MNGAERREHARNTSPYLVVRFGSGEFTTQNWSYGGMLVSGYSGDLGAGSLVTIDGMGVADGSVEDTNIKARVVRADANSGTLALTFLDIDQTGYAILAALK